MVLRYFLTAMSWKAKDICVNAVCGLQVCRVSCVTLFGDKIQQLKNLDISNRICGLGDMLLRLAGYHPQSIYGCCSVECDLFAVRAIHGEGESSRSNKDNWCGVERAADAGVCSQGLWLFSLLLIFVYLYNDSFLSSTWFHPCDGIIILRAWIFNFYAFVHE